MINTPSAIDLTDENVEDFVYTPGALKALNRDLRIAASNKLTPEEIRYIVRTYYTVQNYRIRAANQVRTLSKDDNPVALLEWIFESISTLEKEIQKWMLAYADANPTGEWALSICGIGPVIAAGMLANLDVTRATNISKWWAFAGFDPTKTWERGQKRPWNADLKVLGYKAGESFVKVQNRPADFYGKYFAEYKLEYARRNALGMYADQAADILSKRRIGKDTDAYAAYSNGLLPPAHIHARARRKTVKLFMSHMWQVEYERVHDEKAPNPWILEPNLGGHTDRINVPNHTCKFGPH